MSEAVGAGRASPTAASARPGPPARLLDGDVGPTLIRLAVPMFWGMLAVTTFNIVDTFYVGRLGTAPLAAMGYTFPVVFVIQCVAMGMSVGTSSVLSRAIGEGDHAKVRRLTTDSLALSVVAVVVLAIIGVLTINPVFRLLGATPELIVLIRQYITIWYAGVALLVVPMVGNSAIRATGDTKTPSIIMMIAGGANIILDPLLIFGPGPFPRLGLAGAALATVLSWSLTLVTALWILIRRLDLIDFSIPSTREALDSWRRILYVALPAIGTNLLMPLSTGVLTRMLSGFGTEAVAAFGVGTRLETLAMSGSFALSTIMSPFVGQNFGGGRRDRVREAVHKAIRYAFTWGAGVCILYALLARPLARLFNAHEAVVSTTALYLWIVPISYGAYGAMAQVTTMYNATNHPMRSASVFLLRLFVCMVPLAYAGSRLAGLGGLFAGICLSNFIAAGIALGMVQHFLHRLEHGARP
ncbi:MAG: MATE family efflux transporter [Lentisphaerae bacterium]|nr:MATE family efflux transporter [Lentisphaerota bacterium]